ncbi:MAG: hypothetical protein KA436_01970 [Oligoflexales bacterium]|nr:hypothetical protein [Oligoflexales bacterium]
MIRAKVSPILFVFWCFLSIQSSVHAASESPPPPHDTTLALADVVQAIVHGRMLFLVVCHYFNPAVFEEVDELGYTAAHFASYAGQTAILYWFEEFYPHLLTQGNHHGHIPEQLAKLGSATVAWFEAYRVRSTRLSLSGSFQDGHFLL